MDKVFYANDDDDQDEAIAGSLGELPESIVADSADFLFRIGCYTRYSDGKSEIQWIPREFVTYVSH